MISKIQFSYKCAKFTLLVHSTDFVICQMLLHMTYGFLLLFAFEWTISYQTWTIYIELYCLLLFTIIVYLLNAHIMLLQYVICKLHLTYGKSELWAIELLSTLKRSLDFVSFSLLMSCFSSSFRSLDLDIIWFLTFFLRLQDFLTFIFGPFLPFFTGGIAVIKNSRVCT